MLISNSFCSSSMVIPLIYNSQKSLLIGFPKKLYFLVMLFNSSEGMYLLNPNIFLLALIYVFPLSFPTLSLFIVTSNNINNSLTVIIDYIATWNSYRPFFTFLHFSYISYNTLQFQIIKTGIFY